VVISHTIVVMFNSLKIHTTRLEDRLGVCKIGKLPGFQSIISTLVKNHLWLVLMVRVLCSLRRVIWGVSFVEISKNSKMPVKRQEKEESAGLQLKDKNN
jgi:hypothetical protein